MDIGEVFEAIAAQGLIFDSLEELLTSPLGFGLETATPVQRAICRVASGEPLGDLKHHPDVVESLGGFEGDLSKSIQELIVCAAVRSAKSLIAAALGVWATQTIDLGPATSSGDIPRFSIASIEKDNADAVVAHLLGALSRPGIRPLYISHEDMRAEASVKESGVRLVGSFFFRHPSGRPIEIRVVAGKRAGGSLVSRWSAGCVLDEAPRMVGNLEGVVNYDDMRNAVLGRLLPGAVLFSIGSPWARSGPVYDVAQSEWGRPTEDRIVIKARGPQMNPIWWTDERCERLKRTDPDAYQTDVLAEFLDNEESLFTDAELHMVTREKPDALEYKPGNDYVAFMDAGVSRNSWTFAIGTLDPVFRDDGTWEWIKKIAFYKEWTGTKTKRNNPGAVLSEISAILDTYGLDSCFADQWSFDGFHALALERNFNLIYDDSKPREKTQQYLDLATSIMQKKVELPPHKNVRKDFVLVKKVRKGGVTDVAIRLPETQDGRHCDSAPSIVGCLSSFMDHPHDAPPPEGTPERGNWDAMRRQEIASEMLAEEQERPWWDFE